MKCQSGPELRQQIKKGWSWIVEDRSNTVTEMLQVGLDSKDARDDTSLFFETLLFSLTLRQTALLLLSIEHGAALRERVGSV